MYSVVLTVNPVDETMQGDHSLKSYCTVTSCGLFCDTVVLTVNSVDQTMQGDHSLISYCTVTSCGLFCDTVWF